MISVYLSCSYCYLLWSPLGAITIERQINRKSKNPNTKKVAKKIKSNSPTRRNRDKFNIVKSNINIKYISFFESPKLFCILGASIIFSPIE